MNMVSAMVIHGSLRAYRSPTPFPCLGRHAQPNGSVQAVRSAALPTDCPPFHREALMSGLIVCVSRV